MSGGGEKTEQPSEHKLEQARKKGQVAKSSDAVVLFSLFSTFLFIILFAPFAIKKIIDYWFCVYSQTTLTGAAGFIIKAGRDGLNLWMLISLPILSIAAFGAVVSNLSQFGFLLTAYPIKPDIKKINPVLGMKKLFSLNRIVEFLKQLVKFTVVASVIFLAVEGELINICLLHRIDLFSALNKILQIIYLIITRVFICFLIIAVFDYFWQRFSFIKSMRMTKYEVKKEHKQREGDPHIKQERRRLQQELLESSSVANVADSSVVISNPSHIAVAIRFDEKIDNVPRMVAKGMGKMAREILQEARRKKIPVMRNVPLARDLSCLDINEEIPQRLYDSVAEVLLFIHELENDSQARSN